ncbi:hypothetical protein SAMN04487911_10737 [Arenibacter nanhaiticus]|uniref:Glycine dehydrogenase n=1 Tax=Arenibacter nanhaiticus TaxID=558155 RepID=A0A1M6ESN6_9FLAO|nr:hypothetical protein SAMN04487911_10737 [Arenibacter nanhaiticus]
MSSCKKAAIICTKKQYQEATLWERIQFIFHINICQACKVFSKKNRQLSTLCHQANLKTLPTEEKERLKECLKNEIKSNTLTLK